MANKGSKALAFAAAAALVASGTCDDEGKISDYIEMSHLDSKKKTTRSLKEAIAEDGAKTYFITKTAGKKSAGFPLAAGEYGRAEQGLKDPESFDLILAEKEREKEIEDTLYSGKRHLTT